MELVPLLWTLCSKATEGGSIGASKTINRTAFCSCGQLGLGTSEEPLRVSVCHCLACQRRTGSVFGAQARFRREAVQITGSASAFARVRDEAGKATFHFCPQCGATVYYEFDGKPEHVVVPVGAFTEEKPAHLHLAFVAENRQQVEAFHRAALAAGGQDNGAPGLRPHDHAHYYAAFVMGPDGHNVEAVCHEPES